MSQAAPTPEDQSPAECPTPREVSAPPPPAAAIKLAFSGHGQEMTELIQDLRKRFKGPPSLVNSYIGRSEDAQLARLLIVCAASDESPVLIQGETGTGKQVVAREIHRLSSRSKQPFMPVNCAAISPMLLKAELFGCEVESLQKGFRRKTGLWEAVGDGTLFLDEIGDLHLDHQAKILRALAENKIRRIEGNDIINVSARILSATNRDLQAMIKKKEFREDLYYRQCLGAKTLAPVTSSMSLIY